MKFLFAKLFSLCLFVGVLFSAFTESNTGWSYIQSTNQTFYIFISPMNFVDVQGGQMEGYGDGSNGQTLSESDCGTNPEPCDVLGAFMSRDIDEIACSDAGGYFVNGQCDVCVGWSYYNSYAESSNGSITTTLQINGFDSGGDYDYYCQDGEAPKLKYFDASEEIIYALSSDSELGGFLNNNIFLYWPDCTGISDCNQFQAVASEDDPLINDQNEIPNGFDISSVYPNPFNPSVNITFSLSALEQVNITIYDSIGREIATLFDGIKERGTHEVIWTPEVSIASGNYIIIMETPNDMHTSKVTYVK